MAVNEQGVVLTELPYSGRDEPMSLRIVRLVANASDRDVTDIEPLGRIIDTDALDALFSPARSRRPEHTVEASFRFEGYRIEIDAEGAVRLLATPTEPNW